MKKLTTFAVAITGFIGTSAFAADMGVPTAPPPPPVWNWTGWYAGVNLGASFGHAKTDFNVAPVTTQDLRFIPPVGTAFSPGFGGTNTEYPDGFMGGGQIGYNWQYSPLIVVGVEADFQGAVEKDSNNLINSFTLQEPQPGFPPNTVTGTTSLSYSTNIDWFGTVRPRIGYVWGNGAVMSYVTGGLAYGEVKIHGTSATSWTTGVVPFFSAQAFSESKVNTGWVVGYGTEGRLGTTNWTWKIEGLYMDLGTLDATGVSGGSSFTFMAIPVTQGPGQTFTHTRFTDSILRGGLNYKFY